MKPFEVRPTSGGQFKSGPVQYRYLVALFKRLPLAQTADDYEALLPWNIALPTS